MPAPEMLSEFAHGRWAASEIAILNPTGVRQLAARNDLKQVQVFLPPGHLTDRASMTLAVATSLAEMQDVVGEHVAQVIRRLDSVSFSICLRRHRSQNELKSDNVTSVRPSFLLSRP